MGLSIERIKEGKIFKLKKVRIVDSIGEQGSRAPQLRRSNHIRRRRRFDGGSSINSSTTGTSSTASRRRGGSSDAGDESIVSSLNQSSIRSLLNDIEGEDGSLVGSRGHGRVPAEPRSRGAGRASGRASRAPSLSELELRATYLRRMLADRYDFRFHGGSDGSSEALVGAGGPAGAASTAEDDLEQRMREYRQRRDEVHDRLRRVSSRQLSWSASTSAGSSPATTPNEYSSNSLMYELRRRDRLRRSRAPSSAGSAGSSWRHLASSNGNTWTSEPPELDDSSSDDDLPPAQRLHQYYD